MRGLDATKVVNILEREKREQGRCGAYRARSARPVTALPRLWRRYGRLHTSFRGH